MKLCALIVDDMPLSRARVRRYLASEPDVEIVGECGDGEAASADIARLRPDVVFLDVQMPGMTGLALLDRIPEQERPAIVFITAFDEFAVPAFAAQAVDYLLKPFEQGRMTQALTKVREHLNHRQSPQKGPAGRSKEYLDRIMVKSIGRVVFVDTSQVDWIETAGNYLSLHCGTEVHLVRSTMNQIEKQLDPRQFVRIHRSTLVRIRSISEVQPLSNGDRLVILRDGTKLTLSRSHRIQVRQVLGNI